MLKKKLAYIIPGLFIFLIAFVSPANADSSDITITGNGASSANQVEVSNSSQATVSQTNNSSVTNNITTNQNTGGNTTSANTGGDTNISTGDTSSQTIVNNNVNN